MTDHMTPEEFVEARKSLDMTQTEIGAVLAVNLRQVQRWEKGAIPIPDRARDVLNFLAFGIWPDNWPLQCKGRQAVEGG